MSEDSQGCGKAISPTKTPGPAENQAGHRDTYSMAQARTMDTDLILKKAPRPKGRGCVGALRLVVAISLCGFFQGPDNLRAKFCTVTDFVQI